MQIDKTSFKEAVEKMVEMARSSENVWDPAIMCDLETGRCWFGTNDRSVKGNVDSFVLESFGPGLDPEFGHTELSFKEAVDKVFDLFHVEDLQTRVDIELDRREFESED